MVDGRSSFAAKDGDVEGEDFSQSSPEYWENRYKNNEGGDGEHNSGRGSYGANARYKAS